MKAKIKNECKQQETHLKRLRSKLMGEMIQMNTPLFHKIPNEFWYLQLAVDDTTRTAVGAYFDTQETLNTYYHVFYRIFTNYGIPAMF